MERLEILKADKSDLPEILDLQKLAYQSEAEIYNDFSIPPLTQTLEGIEQEAQGAIILKVVSDRKIVGSVRAFAGEGTCYIGKLIVHPDHRDRGIGKKLIEEIEKCYGGHRYELFTGHLSEKNLALYERLGYQGFETKSITENLQFVYLEKRAKA